MSQPKEQITTVINNPNAIDSAFKRLWEAVKLGDEKSVNEALKKLSHFKSQYRN